MNFINRFKDIKYLGFKGALFPKVTRAQVIILSIGAGLFYELENDIPSMTKKELKVEYKRLTKILSKAV